MTGRWPLAILLFAAFARCATVPMAAPDVDQSAKQFQSPAGKARVYIVRPSAFASAITFKITLDDRTIGLLPYKTYLVTDLEPGEHTLVASGHENDAPVTLNTEAGRVYFLRVGPRPGWLFSRVALYEVPDSEGRKAVLASSLAKGF